MKSHRHQIGSGKRGHPSGLTRTELLVALCVLAVLGTAGGIAWTRFVPNYRLHTSVRDLYTMLQVARITAVRENATVTVSVAPNRRCCEVWLDDGAGAGGVADNGLREAGEHGILSRRLPPGIDVHRVTFSAGRLRYNRRGRPLGGGSFYLKNRRGQFLGISVGLSGSVTVKTSRDGSRWKPF